MRPALFSPLVVRGLTIPNRIGVSPMCQYSCHADGLAHEWHQVHLGSRVIGGAGLVMTEAAAVTEDGRITFADLGIWTDAHAAALKPVADFALAHGAVPGIQLAHAGRKAGTKRPWEGTGADELKGWQPVGATSVAFLPDHLDPRELSATELAQMPGIFASAARRSAEVGFKFFEVHAAHGYLLHELMSPHSNHRKDEYGTDFEGRVRLVLEIVEAVRAALGEAAPISVRVSATDWIEGGWTEDETVALAPLLRRAGADIIDCSTGGNSPGAEIPVGAGFQVRFAERVKKEVGMPVAAVGMITDPDQAEAIIASGRADLVLLGREMLREPYWPRRAEIALGMQISPAVQYAQAY